MRGWKWKSGIATYGTLNFWAQPQFPAGGGHSYPGFFRARGLEDIQRLFRVPGIRAYYHKPFLQVLFVEWRRGRIRPHYYIELRMPGLQQIGRQMRSAHPADDELLALLELRRILYERLVFELLGIIPDVVGYHALIVPNGTSYLVQ